MTSWENKGLLFFDMGDVNDVTLLEISKKLKEFIKINEVPRDNLKMVPHDDKNLIMIEIVSNAFKKFNLTHPQPYFGLDPKGELVAYHPYEGSMQEIFQILNIRSVKLSIWKDDTLLFYSLGELEKLSLGEFMNKIKILCRYLKITPNKIKLFPFQKIMIAAIEKFPGAFIPFQKATNIEPIEVEDKNSESALNFKSCPNCKIANKLSNKFCKNCGSQL